MKSGKGANEEMKKKEVSTRMESVVDR